MIEEFLAAGLGGLGAAALGFGLLVLLALYIYYALALMTIARKLKTEPAWLAWIPLANVYLVWKISKTPTWSGILWIVGAVLSWVPLVGLLPAAMMIFWFWKIAEMRNYPGWISILLLVPLANLVVPGLLAWVDRK